MELQPHKQPNEQSLPKEESKDFAPLININGEILPAEQAKISVFDRGFLYGDSVYEVTRTYNNIPFLLEEHLERLWFSAQQISLNIPLSKKELTLEIKKTLKEVKFQNCYIRIIVTRGEGEIGLDPNLATKGNFILIVKEQKENPSWWYKKGVELIISNTLRNPVNSLDPNIKSGNYLNNLLAMIEAKKLGAFDAVMLNKEGYVTEGTTNNIWLVKGQNVFTPPLEVGILKGLTRTSLINICKQDQIPCFEESFLPEKLLDADEVFITSSTKEIVPVTKINGHKIADGEPGVISKKLLNSYRRFIVNSCYN